MNTKKKESFFNKQLAIVSLAVFCSIACQGCHFNRNDYGRQYAKQSRRHHHQDSHSRKTHSHAGHENSYGNHHDYRTNHAPVSQEHHYRMSGGSYGVHTDGHAHSPGASGHHH